MTQCQADSRCLSRRRGVGKAGTTTSNVEQTTPLLKSKAWFSHLSLPALPPRREQIAGTTIWSAPAGFAPQPHMVDASSARVILPLLLGRRGLGRTAVELGKFPRKRRRLLPLLPQGRRGLGRGGPNEFSCRRTPRVKTDPPPPHPPPFAGGQDR